ncbi:GNAT family N-acetyltransferase [Aestuariibius insulae]|uniref:GNAT family N-acetyltransferase n=1 Tax=Aestuariibius insulae TaxID=2058287 RepID=UPI00345EE9EC
MTRITPGFDETERPAVAKLYWGAFGGKLGRVLGPKRLALKFIVDNLRPDHALVARSEAGQMLGVVGFKTYEGALVGGGFHDLRRVYGILGATWRAAILMLLERDTDNERFLLDGLFVSPQARGQGIGTALLNAICQEALSRGYRKLRLDVIDSNPRARALYEREGFEPKGTTDMGPFSKLFGFSSATTMVKTLA